MKLTEENIKDILVNEIDRQQSIFGCDDWKLKDFDFVQKQDFTFIAAHVSMGDSKEWHRYMKLAYHGVEQVYKSCNTIGSGVKITVESVHEKTENYFNYMATKLKRLS